MFFPVKSQTKRKWKYDNFLVMSHFTELMYRRNREGKVACSYLNIGRVGLLSSNHPFHEACPCVFVLV